MNRQREQRAASHNKQLIEWRNHANYANSAFACCFCDDRTTSSTTEELWTHALEHHAEKLPNDEKDEEDWLVWRAKYEAVSKKFVVPARLQRFKHRLETVWKPLPCSALRLTKDSNRPTKDDSQPRKPAWMAASSAPPEPLGQGKRPLSTPRMTLARSLSGLQALNIGGGTPKNSGDVTMQDISDENAAAVQQPRKRAALGDGISAGSAPPLPFRDSESPPPRRSKARPTSAPYGSNPDTDIRRSGNLDETTQRPSVAKKSL